MSHEIPDHLNPTHDPERERELREAQAAILKSTDEHIALVEDLKSRFPGRVDWNDFLARLRRIRALIENWQDADAEKEEFDLQFERLMGEAAAQAAKSTSVAMQQIVNLPEEKLAQLSEIERGRHFDTVRDWEEQKDTFLGILPIEERKRIEGE